MKSRKATKKALSFLGLGAILIGSIATTAIVTNNTPNLDIVSQKSQELNKNTNCLSYCIDDKLAKSTTTFSTINGKEIVDAIESYNQEPTISNITQAYQFSTYSGQTNIQSIIKDVKQNIKYIDLNDNLVKELPDRAIFISYDTTIDVYNVRVELSSINGKVTYFKNNNVKTWEASPKQYTTNDISTYASNVVEVNGTLSFNAINLSSGQSLIVEIAKPSITTMIYILLGIIGSIGLLLIIIFVSKRLMAEKYMR